MITCMITSHALYCFISADIITQFISLIDNQIDSRIAEGIQYIAALCIPNSIKGHHEKMIIANISDL